MGKLENEKIESWKTGETGKTGILKNRKLESRKLENSEMDNCETVKRKTARLVEKLESLENGKLEKVETGKSNN